MAKAVKKQALGRGLSALLKDPQNDIKSAEDENADKVVGNIVEIDIETIKLNPFQPRTRFDEEALHELAGSIKELGVIQPVTVRKSGFNTYQLVSGERRYKASRMAGLKSIPAYIRIANDQEMLEMALVENIQREDLDPIEVALSYKRLMDEIKLTQEQMSVRIGKKRSTIANYLRLLKLDPIIQTGIRDGFLSMGHGRALINIEAMEVQLDIYEKIIKNRLSVRQTEQLVKKYREGTLAEAKKKMMIPEYYETALEDMRKSFGSEINVKVNSKGKGRVIIPFHSEGDFDRIKKMFK